VVNSIAVTSLLQMFSTHCC